MDVIGLLNAPWLQPLAALVVTVLGSWLGARGAGSPRPAISQHAVTHGERSRITQTVNHHTWHVSEPARPTRSAPQQVVVKKSSDDDDSGMILGLMVAVVVGVSALTWAVASNWSAVALVLRLLVLVSLFILALTWWRWPSGVVGAWPLRVSVTVVGSAILWALVVLPVPVGGEPSLSAIDEATRHLDIWPSIERTMALLGMSGIFAYEMRLGGLTILLILLATMAGRGLGAVLADCATRHDPPRLGLLRFGNWMMGPARMGFGYFAGSALVCAVAVIIIHPCTLGLLLSRFPVTSLP